MCIRDSVITPSLLKALLRIFAKAQREPDAVLNGIQVWALADPYLTGDNTANCVDSYNLLAFFVGRYCRFPVITLHQTASLAEPYGLSGNRIPESVFVVKLLYG